MNAATKNGNITAKHTADAVAGIHALWLASLVASIPLSLKWRPLRYLGGSMILATVGSWLVFGDCPLFLLENHLRKKNDPKDAYRGSFSSHYFNKYLHVSIPTGFFTATGYAYAGLTSLMLLNDLNQYLERGWNNGKNL